MNIDQNSTITRSRKQVDAGLRSYLNGIYTRMTAGVLVTALVAMVIGSSQQLTMMLMGGPQAYLFMFAPLAITMFGFNPMTMSSSRLKTSFFLISAAYGVCFSTLSFAASGNVELLQDVTRALFITVAMFAALSIFGYTTKKDLSGMGTFLFMGMIGLVAVSVLNMFMASSILGLMISAGTVLIFSGLTAYETQKMKQVYHPSSSPEALARQSWSSALNLYISFIALFQAILSLLSSRD